MIKVVVNGAHGRMGQMAVNAIEHEPELTMVAETGRGDDLAATIRETQADVVVELTTASAGYDNVKAIIEVGARPVVGTSGFTQQKVDVLQKLCEQRQLGGVIAPNFSIGAVLMMQFAKQAAIYFNQVEIIERHHTKKQDAPSGTALRTAELIAAGQGKLERIDCDETIAGAHGGVHCKVPIHSLRLLGSLAHQEVIFGGVGELLTLKHDTSDRECFAPGILLACKKVMALDTLVFGLENLL